MNADQTTAGRIECGARLGCVQGLIRQAKAYPTSVWDLVRGKNSFLYKADERG